MNSKNRWQQVVRGGLAVLSLALLASCGGGKREAFHPGHMYVFGDEYSYIDVNQTPSSNNTYARYSVNYVTSISPITVYSAIYPWTWTQYLSSHYGKGTSPCANTDADQTSLCSAPGDTVDDTITKIKTKNFQKDELVVIMAGTRDVLNAYQTFKSSGTLDEAGMKNAGIKLAQKINAIVTTGARVAVVTLPDIGLSPYAVAEDTSHGHRDPAQSVDCSTGDGRPAATDEYAKAMSYLTSCFNYGLRGANGITNDGHKIALINAFDWSILIAKNTSVTYPYAAQCASVTHTTAATYDPTTCNYDNVTTPSSPTTTADISGATYLWSFGPWLSIAGHQLLANLAMTRVDYNWDS